MKSKVLIVFALVVFIIAGAMGQEDKIPKTNNEGTLRVACTPDVFELTQEWVNEFRNKNVDIAIEVMPVSYPFSMETNKNEAVIIITSGSLNANLSEFDENIVIGRQVVVPIINSENPVLKDIALTGISIDAMGNLIVNAGTNKQAPVIINNQPVKFNYYALNSSFIRSQVDNLLKISGSDLSLNNVESTDVFIKKIKEDTHGFGFCKLADIIDNENLSFIEGISLLPIDKNGNSKLDYMEQIYNTPNAFLRGVWIGKYPSELTTNLYITLHKDAYSKNQEVFLSWILVDGQKNLGKYGFQELGSSEIASRLNKIESFNNKEITIQESHSNLKAIGLFVLILVLLAVLIDFAIFRYNRRRSKEIGVYNQQIIYNENTIKAPMGLFFDKTHTWAFMQEDGNVKIGMSDFIPSITGPFTSVVLKQVGETIKKGEMLLSVIQEGKQLNIKAPVSGNVRVVNEKLTHDATLINFSPYNQGWIYAIGPSNWTREIQFLLMFDKFKIWLNEEYLRLKDFLAIIKTPEGSIQPALVMQEGGEVRKSVLKDLDPKVWEDFQQHFIEVT